MMSLENRIIVHHNKDAILLHGARSLPEYAPLLNPLKERNFSNLVL